MDESDKSRLRKLALCERKRKQALTERIFIGWAESTGSAFAAFPVMAFFLGVCSCSQRSFLPVPQLHGKAAAQPSYRPPRRWLLVTEKNILPFLDDSPEK
jgi:hypothetical protein